MYMYIYIYTHVISLSLSLSLIYIYIYIYITFRFRSEPPLWRLKPGLREALGGAPGPRQSEKISGAGIWAE